MNRFQSTTLNNALKKIRINAFYGDARLGNYDYINELASNIQTVIAFRRWDTDGITDAIASHTIQKAVLALVPTGPLVGFDMHGEGEDLSYLCNVTQQLCMDCDEDGLGKALSEKFIAFTFLWEEQEERELQALTDLAND